MTSSSAKVLYFPDRLKKPEMPENTDMRASPRETCWIRAVLEANGQTAIEAVLTDISATGVRVVADHSFEPGEIVELVGFNFFQALPCEIVWARQNEYGIRFCA